MALKINSINSAMRQLKSEKITPLYIKEKPVITNLANDGAHIMQDSHLNFIDKFIFKTLDKISPVMDKHSILRNNIMKITEKILKANNDI